MSGGLYSNIAHKAVEHFILHQEPMPRPDALPAQLSQQKACYVSIFENPGRKFRSMYGTALPKKSTIAEEIINNTYQAISARTQRPLRKQDLKNLSYEIAVLGPLERISGPHQLDPNHFGLYVRSDRGKHSILLPQRTGIETADDQVATAMRESGIDRRQESASLYRFRVMFFE